MKKMSFKEMEEVQGGRSKIAFGAMCSGMAFIIGTITFGVGILATAACLGLSYDISFN
ncbi:MAG: class IIb bacteriocin, lactobin A/cerein 7B family [Mariniphaga sp.]